MQDEAFPFAVDQADRRLDHLKINTPVRHLHQLVREHPNTRRGDSY